MWRTSSRLKLMKIQKEIMYFGNINFGNYDEVDKLVSQYPEMIDFMDENGNTGLNIAVSKSWTKTVELLCRKGVNVNRFNFEGETPLSIAVKNEDVKIIRILLKYNAKMGISPDSEITNPDVTASLKDAKRSEFSFKELNKHLWNAMLKDNQKEIDRFMELGANEKMVGNGKIF